MWKNQSKQQTWYWRRGDSLPKDLAHNLAWQVLLAAGCQIWHESNLLINAKLKVIKTIGGENWMFIPQQVPQVCAEQGMETTVMLQDPALTCWVCSVTSRCVKRALETEGERSDTSYSGDLRSLLLSSWFFFMSFHLSNASVCCLQKAQRDYDICCHIKVWCWLWGGQVSWWDRLQSETMLPSHMVLYSIVSSTGKRSC